MEKIIAKAPITLELVKKINKLLCRGTIDERQYKINQERAGEFKKQDYVVEIHEVGSTAEKVEADLTALLEEIQEYSGNRCLTAAAYLHCRFESIHPFSDGNGRTLLNYYLMAKNLPSLILDDENQNVYYEVLLVYDEQKDVEAMRTFIEFSLIKT